MRNIKIAPGEHYHVFNRGNDHKIIFVDDSDRIRFIFLITSLQTAETQNNISYQIAQYRRHGAFHFYKKTSPSLSGKRYVELVNFCLMSNHFHLTLFEKEEGGIAKYMQRVSNAYTKYFNTKYEKSGHLFSGPYRAVHIKNNTQLLHLSSYIHRNPREMKEWRGKEHSYPWSSFQDYVGEKNRWGELLKNDIVLGQFEKKEGYKTFVSTSTAKQIFDALPAEHLEMDEED